MDGWEIVAWLVVALVTVLRVALVVGIVALVVVVARSLLMRKPTYHAT